VTSLRRNQFLGMLGAVPAIAVVLLVWDLAPHRLSGLAPTRFDTAERLAYAAKWLVGPALTLLAGVLGAARRGFYADAIEGSRTPANHGLEITLRYTQNTLEQLVLAAIAWTALSVSLPPGQMVLIPAAALLFVVGRITFWVGYAIHPMGRAFGMALTALPTVLAFVALAAQLFA
jgi:hypothetical protein